MRNRYVKPSSIFRDKNGRLLHKEALLTDGKDEYTVETVRPDFAVLLNKSTNTEILVIPEETKANFEVVRNFVIRSRKGASKW